MRWQRRGRGLVGRGGGGLGLGGLGLGGLGEGGLGLGGLAGGGRRPLEGQLLSKTLRGGLAFTGGASGMGP